MTETLPNIRHNLPGRNGIQSVIRASLLGYCAHPALPHSFSDLRGSQYVDDSSKTQDTPPTEFEKRWFGSQPRKSSTKTVSESYCPLAYRASVSPINHGSRDRDWDTSSSLRSVSVRPSRLLRCASGAGTGYAMDPCRSTSLWDSGPLSSSTCYRDFTGNLSR